MKNKTRQVIISTLIALTMIFNSFSMISAETPVPLALTSATGVVGGYVNLYLTMGANSGLGGGSFTVTYDHLKLEPLYAAVDPAPGAQSIISDQAAMTDPITEAPIGGSSTLLANISTPGTILVSVINTVGFKPGGNLFKLRFKLLGAASGAMPVNVSVSTFTAATVGNPAIPYTITAQGVVSGPVTATPTPIPTPVKPVVSLSDSPTAGKFNVSIAGIIPTYKYQIWSYEKIESTIFDGNTYDANNWKLVANYALGSTFTNYLTGTGTKEINDFASISGTYTIAVRVVNESGVFVEQLKDAFTDVAINNIKISKVLVDSNVSMDTTEVKEITSGATVAFDVIANITSGTTYTAVTNPITTTMTSGTNGSFIWNISALKPGKYTVTLSATLSGNTDTRTIEIDLYDSSVTYGEISNIVINPTAPPVVTQPVVTQPVVTQPVVTQPVVTQPVVTQPVARVDTEIVPEIVNATGKTFQYTISEPGRAPYKSPDPFAATVTQISDISLLATEYGIYNLSAVIKNADGVVEDRYITSITNKRPGANSEVTFIEPPTTITKGTQRLISASATIPGVTSNSIEYSFWRYDARGWVMVRDYSTDSTLSWTPARVGEYSIQARAKGPGAKSYEAASSIEVSVTDTTDFKADVSNVTISTIGSSARRPVTITATATSTSEVLMYKFIITTPNSFFTKETSYSLSPKLTFIAGKAGEYTVRVLVKNDVSYGKYDYITDPALPMFKLTIN